MNDIVSNNQVTGRQMDSIHVGAVWPNLCLWHQKTGPWAAVLHRILAELLQQWIGFPYELLVGHVQGL